MNPPPPYPWPSRDPLRAGNRRLVYRRLFARSELGSIATKRIGRCTGPDGIRQQRLGRLRVRSGLGRGLGSDRIRARPIDPQSIADGEED